MSKHSLQELNELVDRFIVLANEINGEKNSPYLVSAALMSASGLYATFATSGNEGYLTESGIDKVVTAYRMELVRWQAIKKAEAEKQGTQPPDEQAKG
ncbi:MAG: DUF3144 domain-containing protein [Chromatiales bacterium]|nr:DUF3144 domain-containing protein [Chromatiales bacterium]